MQLRNRSVRPDYLVVHAVAQDSSDFSAFSEGLTPSGASSSFHRMKWRDCITTDPGILKGKPCIKGTRIPAALILGYLAAGQDATAIMKEFPDLKTEDIAASLDYARDLATFEAVAA